VGEGKDLQACFNSKFGLFMRGEDLKRQKERVLYHWDVTTALYRVRRK